MHRIHRAALPALFLLAAPAAQALAHGFAGDRFFPATLLTDDPFVADEMSLPTLTINPKGSDGSRETDLDFDLAKRLTPDLGVTFSDGWRYVHVPGAPGLHGLENLETGLQYQLFIDPRTETMALAGVDVSWGHTGRIAAGADDFTTISPGFDFGKGFGDLPPELEMLRPFAITGNLSFDFPVKTNSAGSPNPNVFNYGFAFEYSLEYLQHHVRDVGLSAPFDRMVPLVEIAFATPVNRGQANLTTGTIQPGVIWAGQYFQIGAEAILPANRATGRGIGGIVQFHLFLDDLFPDSIGRPLLSH